MNVRFVVEDDEDTKDMVLSLRKISDSEVEIRADIKGGMSFTLGKIVANPESIYAKNFSGDAVILRILRDKGQRK